MTEVVPGFDDRLNEILEQQAAKAGEAVDGYVRRAVVTRLVKELSEDENSELGQLLRHLEDARIEPATDDNGSAGVARPLFDPARLEAVAQTGQMDSPREESYDRLVKMVAEALSVPSAAVSFIDDRRQFFKSGVGLPPGLDEAREITVDQSMCQYTVDGGKLLVVEDARLDEVMKNHPAVLNKLALSYMGVPLTDDNGHAVGTLCVWDEQPRQWTIGHQQILQDLAWIVRERVFG
ncbi:MAG: GAF domain-containing protein [Rhodococcus sp. (in: high G+C Gram-positive bacteria)]